ncbi:uncharacterized protein LOC133340941 isoform X3 [Lethenteron reissneri]|uniref:uncharacterized protein LOC133340941 isoform X3 n=1 Tax=Lethenteron reissneri TaxID=7753 RepID=UPI002AB7C73C|nr:uncharacterized protein LOC133340941 isoform X3 [Lethenteron reissneri]
MQQVAGSTSRKGRGARAGRDVMQQVAGSRSRKRRGARAGRDVMQQVAGSTSRKGRGARAGRDVMQQVAGSTSRKGRGARAGRDVTQQVAGSAYIAAGVNLTMSKITTVEIIDSSQSSVDDEDSGPSGRLNGKQREAVNRPGARTAQTRGTREERAQQRDFFKCVTDMSEDEQVMLAMKMSCEEKEKQQTQEKSRKERLERMVPCPLCLVEFLASDIEQHASECCISDDVDDVDDAENYVPSNSKMEVPSCSREGSTRASHKTFIPESNSNSSTSLLSEREGAGGSDDILDGIVISNSPIKSFRSISQSPDCLIDFKNQFNKPGRPRTGFRKQKTRRRR